MRATGACRASHAMLNCPSEATEYVAMSIGIALVRTASTTTLGTPTSAILRYREATSRRVGSASWRSRASRARHDR